MERDPASATKPDMDRFASEDIRTTLKEMHKGNRQGQVIGKSNWQTKLSTSRRTWTLGFQKQPLIFKHNPLTREDPSSRQPPLQTNSSGDDRNPCELANRLIWQFISKKTSSLAMCRLQQSWLGDKRPGSECLKTNGLSLCKEDWTNKNMCAVTELGW